MLPPSSKDVSDVDVDVDERDAVGDEAVEDDDEDDDDDDIMPPRIFDRPGILRSRDVHLTRKAPNFHEDMNDEEEDDDDDEFDDEGWALSSFSDSTKCFAKRSFLTVSSMATDDATAMT